MVARRTVDLLPEIFKTSTNRKFLAATLDQLTQEPNVVRTQGYVGRRVGPGVNPADNYVTEPTATRVDYQLEPGVIFLKPETNLAEDVITYPGMIDALNLQGADTSRQDRLFQSEYYAWDSFCDLDKFSNYSQYYWLPQGPDSVDVFSTDVPTTDNFVVTRDTTDDSYSFSGLSGQNPVITLVRGGSYTFDVNQTGNRFWIQAAPGISGTMPATPNISSRDVLGVVNNGEDLGTVTFNVPLKSAQDFYFTMASIGTVDLITDLKFNQLNNVYVSNFLQEFPDGIDGITNLDGLTIVFSNRIANAQDGGWQVTTQFDPLEQASTNNGLPGSYDNLLFDQTTDLTVEQRYSVWQIQYVADDDDNFYMQLTAVLTIQQLNKFQILFGEQYASTQWFKNAEGYFERIPLLTAVLDTLYYQDNNNELMFGQIRLIDQGNDAPIDVNDIIGAQTYTSPNGVIFTNGLKIQLRGTTVPARFQNVSFYVEGVGSGPGINQRVGFIDGEAYFGAYHVVSGQKITGKVSDSTVFQQYIYDTVEDSLDNIGLGTPAGAPLPNASQPGAPDGNGIRLLPVENFVTPETYTQSASLPFDSTPYDVGGYDETLNAPEILDYITINRASRDRNAWSRSNRWFHEDVIRVTAEYNNNVVVIDNNQRAKRPIIEFRADMKLFNFGTQGKTPVNILDQRETDALSNINGQTGYGVDGYTFIDGTLVIFAADIDPEVRNKIYRVDFINPDGLISTLPVINLTAITDGQALIDQTVVCLSGNTQQGLSFWFDGSDWILAQEKTSVNQPPRFDVYDIQGRSFGDPSVYPSTNFQGSRLFGYAESGSTVVDEVLGFGLRYLNINNVGDIVFENYLYTDAFTFTQDNVGQTLDISTGFPRQYLDRVSFTDLLGWLPAAAENRSRQVFRFIYAGVPLIFDVPAASDTVYPPLQIFVGGIFIDPDQYQVVITTNSTVVTFNDPPAEGTVIEAQIISNVASAVAFYQVPLNLENNPLNENSDTFTLGTIRTHYDSIGQNLRRLQGPINGANNTRDLGNILIYGDNIVQHSSPLALTGVFLRRQQYELFNALIYNSQEYQKFKARLLDLVSKADVVDQTATQVLDTILQEMTLGRSEISPFYWSDMIPAGETFIENSYTYSLISTPVFDTVQTYDFDTSNYQALLVFVNNQLLTLNYDYTVGPDAPIVTITTPLSVGDDIVIREYPTTYGSFVPNTPTKVGLYPAYRPEIYIDTSYITPTTVIRGHDGSITVAFQDIRDQVLLQFETRIFNNLKVPEAVPLPLADVIPGQFRTTDYTLAEINQILSQDFLSWVGWNKLDYSSQQYVSNNEFTYNYSQSSNRLDDQPLLGAWRGIYDYFYDTTAPTTRPWEMLGFSQRPEWWESTYGPAPYTSGNLVLWEDLAQGLVNDPNGAYYLPQYARPDLLEVIPAGSEGALLSPLYATVGNYDATSFRRSWVFGDDGPVENVWRTSSAFPFAVMRLLALTKPAKFFSLCADRDRYRFDNTVGQWLWDDRYRLDASRLNPIYGDGTSKASYLNWIIDYNQQLGNNSTQDLETSLANIAIRLCWRVAGYTDKKYLKLYSERSTPTSQNAGLLLPDESYQILLYKNQAFEQITYSSVIIQSTDTGWLVLGYSANKPYFETLVSVPNGNTTILTAGGSTVRVPVDYSQNIVRVPYGFVFTTRSAVCDFLLSYGQVLQRQGLTFDSRENGYILDWRQMAVEFLYWSNQGWAIGSLINLNPNATKLSVTRPGEVAESIIPSTLENIILNQNRQAIRGSNLIIDRLDNTFAITSDSNNTINYVNLRFTAYEHLIVLDNVSIFADLIYQPVTGARQSRILASGWKSGGWDGTVNAPGFVLNQDNILAWSANQVYAKGEIVLFKDQYWTASTIIQPSNDFNYTLWVKADYDQIQKGLLPNAANASDQLATAYSVYNANLEQEIDLFSYGLIGFRPREYMQALNLDDVSQVQLYQQFLGTKGTVRSAEIFSLANLGKEIAQYDIYEYWAMQRATYGANANRSYVELLLNEAKLSSDPGLVQVIYPEQISQADQTILLSNIWKSSYKLSSPDFLPTLSAANPDQSLPTAGYVNFEDVDLSVFSIDDISTLDANLSEIGVGTIIWVAKTSAYNWNIYSVELVPGEITQVSDNLDGRSLVTFNRPHGLRAGQYVIIRFFSEEIDGAYAVLSVPSITTLVIDYAFVGFQTSAIGDGVGFSLQSSRVAQPADISNLPYANKLQPGAKVWVDNNGFDQWTVLEKTNVYETAADLQPQFPESDSRFGSAVAQGFQNLVALIGSPAYNPDSSLEAPGAVYAFVKADNNQYTESSLLQVSTANISAFGNSIDIGDQNWAVVGASASNNDQGYAMVLFLGNSGTNNFDQRQLLLAPDQDFGQGKFGQSVAISQDERWLYVGAPAHNKVYAFGRVDVQNQEVEYITDGITSTFNWSDHIVLTSPASAYPQQLNVVLNNQVLLYNVDYQVNGPNITLSPTPGPGLILSINRRQALQVDQKFTADAASTASASGNSALFNVNNIRGDYTVELSNGGFDYVVGEILTINEDLVATPDVTPPAPLIKTYVSDSGVQLTLNNTTNIVAGMTLDGVGFDSGQFVISVDTVNDITLNAAPDSTPSGSITFSHDIKIRVTAVSGAGTITGFVATGSGIGTGTVFALDPYLATAVDIWSFSVVVNNDIYRPWLDYDFNSDSATLSLDLVFNAVPPPGALITVTSKTQFSYVDELTVSGLPSDAGFGSSVSTTTDGRTVLIGCPRATVTNDETNDQAGQVYVFDRATQRFQVTSTTSSVFNTVETMIAPTNVSVNGVFLINTELNLNGGFTVDPGLISLDISASLEVGDIIEVETNQFALMEVIESNSVSGGEQFGYVVDQCVNNCSLYIGKPFDSTVAPQAGSVEFWNNQSRIYGTITSLKANPVITIGSSIRINNYYVTASGTTIADLVADVRAASIPNVTCNPTDDLLFIANGVETAFDASSVYAPALAPVTPKVYLNDVLQVQGVDYQFNTTTFVVTFASAPGAESEILIVSGRITFTVTNADSAPATDKLQIAPGTGTLWNDLVLEPYVYQQTITSPVTQSFAEFGKAVFISDDTRSLTIGAPNGTVIVPTTFDNNTTTFDALSTTFSNPIPQSGVVYLYDFLAAANPSVANPGQFVFGQQIYNNNLASGDAFGTAIDLTTGTLLAGAPGSDFGGTDAGFCIQLENPTRGAAWQALRTQTPVVDIELMNSIFMYNLVPGGTNQYFDFFDPLQGKLLGVVRQNLDYIGAVDPAAYNVGEINNFGNRWSQSFVGQIWWNTNNVRFIDPNQDDIVYASRRWGQIFPGSSVDIYQWISSTVPPAQYVGPGAPLNTTSYTVSSSVNDQGVFQEIYYFWVSGITEVNRAARKTLSVDTIRRYIESPKTSGISYVAPINSSTLAIYNGLDYISAQDTVLHIEYDRIKNDDAVHVQYQLIPQDRADGFLSPDLYRKFLDSFCGADSTGNAVPDPMLPPSEKYGVQFRPRQSMFVNRFAALENYLTRINNVMLQFPISETHNTPLLNSSDPEPTASSGAWDKKVENYEQLTFQDIQAVSLGYRYLVASDSTNNGLWTIYQVVDGGLFGSRQLQLIQVQTYDTRLYWSRVDWYRPAYDKFTRILLSVPNYASLATLTVANGSVVKVTSNGQGKWELYQYENTSWTRVGLQDGTIQFSEELWNYSLGRFGFDIEVFDAQYFDQEPVIETRKIIEAINQEILIGDLLIERNRALILTFNYMLSEQLAPTWLTKTSLIDVDHVIRNLEPFQIYRQDNQDFVIDYIQEVKPYHTQVKQFNLIYRGNDTYLGNDTDFDLPAYFDTAQNLYVSPVLDNTGTLSTTSSVPSTSPLWQTWPYNQWYNNYLLSIASVTVIDGGIGYTVAPQITVVGDAVEPAVMSARINSAGQVISIEVENPGQGYLTTAVILIEGGNGTGARAVSVMQNNLVRGISTVIRYDRYQYASTINEWSENEAYAQGTQVRFDNRVWQANSAIPSGDAFDPEEWTIVNPGTTVLEYIDWDPVTGTGGYYQPTTLTTGVDRTMGWYTPTVNEPGLDLALLISGVDYPGVQVDAPDFNQNTGFDIGNYDINPFDNISFGPEGLPTYDPAILDAIYESNFLDSFLGTRPTDINVDGGAFIDTYSSHAPEELVPGSVFDTLDMRVFTTPGSDWLEDGHGWPQNSRKYQFDSAAPILDFQDLLDYSTTIMLYNQTTGVKLNLGTDYTVDWVAYTVSILGNASQGDVLVVVAYQLGGGNQILIETKTGATVSSSVVLPVEFDLIYELVIFRNGQFISNYSYSAQQNSTIVTFSTPLTLTDRVTVFAMGYQVPQYSWSLPLTQIIVAQDDGLVYTLDESLQGTNPANIIVCVNGVRARPYAGVFYTADGSSLQYYLPSRGGYDPALVSDNDVAVYVNNQPLVLGVGFTVDPYVPGFDRSITFAIMPDAGDGILISCRFDAQYFVVGDQLQFRPDSGLFPIAGDIISVTTFNDTAQQDLLTQVFVGPTTQGVIVGEGYDDTVYDQGSITGEPGSFDYGIGDVIETNRFDIGTVIQNPDNLTVTLDGNYLFNNIGFIVEGTELVILGPVINSTSVVAITSHTQSPVPGSLAFRIFQDMRGLQSTYRITPQSTTVLTQSLSASGDIIYVEDAAKLDEPNLAQGIFGLITIDGERITYRERDVIANTLTGLRRGTAGTGAAPHDAGTPVYSIGSGNLVPAPYQNVIVYNNTLSDGSTSIFVAENIVLDMLDSTELVEAVRVYVGGILQTSGYTVTGSNPVTVDFDTAPNAGYQVSIRIVQGQSWYEPGSGTASNGIALQEQTTAAARFIQGLT